MAAVLIIDSRFPRLPTGSLRSEPTALGRRLLPRDIGTLWQVGSGGLLEAAVATAKAEAAEAVLDRRAALREDVTTTPALLLICGESGTWKLLRADDKHVMSVWKLLRGVADALVNPVQVLSVSLLPRLPEAPFTRR